MKKYRYLILAALVLLFAGATALLWKPLMLFAENPETLKAWAEETGPLSASSSSGR